MMKKLVLALSLIIGLSSVNQAQAGTKIKIAIGLVAAAVVGACLYKYYCDEQVRVQEQIAASAADEGAVLKHS
jgi:hypothetical protein